MASLLLARKFLNMQKLPNDEFTRANQNCRWQGNELVLSPVQIQRSIVCDIIMKSNFALEHYAMLSASGIAFFQSNSWSLGNLTKYDSKERRSHTYLSSVVTRNCRYQGQSDQEENKTLHGL